MAEENSSKGQKEQETIPRANAQKRETGPCFGLSARGPPISWPIVSLSHPSLPCFLFVRCYDIRNISTKHWHSQLTFKSESSMSRPFLFGGSSQATQSKYLVEFKAGKMTMDGSTVKPINKKGTVYLHQSEDQLIHFCWKDRTSGQTEDDWIIFPDDAEFKRVTQCTTGRVFVLKFKTNQRRLFFWMQEPSSDKDDEYCQKINDFINNPPPPGSNIRGSAGQRSESGGGGLDQLGSVINETDLQQLFNNVSPQQLMQMIGGVGGLPSAGGLAGLLGAHASSGGSSGRSRGSGSGLTTSGNSSSGQGASTTSTGSNNQAPRTSSSVSSGSIAPIQLGDLRNIISNLNVPGEASNSTPSGPQVDLASSINYEALKPLLSNESFMSHVRGYLPPRLDESGQPVPVDSTQVSEQLAATVSSPQFQQALSLFSTALQSGQLGPLIAQFNLGEECVTAANNGDLEGFVRALEKNAKQPSTATTSQESSSEDRKSDDMALD